jgi:hypothetical protein
MLTGRIPRFNLLPVYHPPAPVHRVDRLPVAERGRRRHRRRRVWRSRLSARRPRRDPRVETLADEGVKKALALLVVATLLLQQRLHHQQQRTHTKGKGNQKRFSAITFSRCLHHKVG